MTTVTIRKNSENEYVGFICMGHAEYAKPGKPDIVCAGISALVINTLNAMEELHHEQFTVADNAETGFIRCDFQGNLKRESIILMDAMVFGLQNMQKEYGKKYLLVKFEEV